MTTAVFISLGLLTAVALVTLLVLYLRYSSSPAARWKRRVNDVLAEQKKTLREAERRLRSAEQESGQVRDRLRQEYLARHLRGLAVEELIRFPGIGPVTVSRLRDDGFTSIFQCLHGNLQRVPGVGPSREADLRKALRQVERDAESRFDAGACPEAAALAAELTAAKERRATQQHDDEAVIRTARNNLQLLREREQIARRITFLGHLFGNEPPGLTEELLHRPLTKPVSSPPASIPAEKRGSLPEKLHPAMTASVPGPTDRLVEASFPPAAVIIPATVETCPPVAAHQPDSIPAVVAEPSAPEDLPLKRLRVVLGFGLAVAKADGRVAASERKQVRAFAIRRYAAEPTLQGRLDSLIESASKDVATIGDALWDVRKVIPAESWPELYQFAVSIADAAGERNAREVECLARIAEELGIVIGLQPKSTPAPELKPASLSDADCRGILEIAPETSLAVELVRRQYRLLSDRYAVEKFAQHAPEFIAMAAEKRTNIEKAARQLLAAYNEPLEPPEPDKPADLRHNPELDEVFG